MDETIERREFIPSPELAADAVNWPRLVKKPNPVHMRRVDEPFDVETSEGRLGAKPGDFIAYDPLSGHFWPVAADYVALHYEPYVEEE
jgi:hypothetical protein